MQALLSIKSKTYTKQTVNHEVAGRMEMEKRKRRLVAVVAEARTVIEHTSGITDREIVRRVTMLKRILNDNTQQDADGNLIGLLQDA